MARSKREQLNWIRVGAAACCALLASSGWAEPPKDFTVQSGSQRFQLSEARPNWVALHFLLKTECPLCNRLVAEYSRQAPTVAGVMHVFLDPDPEEDLARFRSQLAEAGAPVPIYRDEDAALARAYGIPAGYEFHGQTMHYPALILLDETGREVYRHVGRDNTDRLSFAAFEKIVDENSRGTEAAHLNVKANGPALDGFDPVSYFTGQPAPGRAELSSRYRGATYRFASEENRRTFAAAPGRYAPQYGGWCATAMAEGQKVAIDPTRFKITGDRLFLFYKGWRGDALKAWNQDEAALTRQADAAWRKLTTVQAK